MQTKLPTAVQRLAERLYGTPIIRNSARGELVEEIVLMALEPEWQLSGDWHECDLIGPGGLRIQVKQSAARQSWHVDGAAPTRGNYLTKHKTGRYLEDGVTWIAERSRNADIFVFAWHPVSDAGADHRDPTQWLFYLVAERDLPDQQSLSLPRIKAQACAVRFADLGAAVKEMMLVLKQPASDD